MFNTFCKYHAFTLNRRISKKFVSTRGKTNKVLEMISQFETSNVLDQPPVVWDRAKGHSIYDALGNKWIDMTSTIFVTNSGHGNRQIIKAINSQAKKLTHSYSYPTQIRADYLKELISFVPSSLEKASLYSAGTEATERALKLMKLYGLKSNPKRKYIITYEGNYHGKTFGAEQLIGNPKSLEWMGYKDPNIIQLPFPYPWELDDGSSGVDIFIKHLKILDDLGITPSEICGFMLESFQGWGALFYPFDYVRTLREYTNKHKILLGFDEIQSGFGRTGKLFAYEHYEVDADFVCCGKGISGSLPLSAVLGRADLIDLDNQYTSTHGGHPIACAAGLANIKFFKSNNLIQLSLLNQSIFEKHLFPLQKDLPNRIGSIYGKGSLFGVFILKNNSKNQLDVDVEMANKIVDDCLNEGVFSIKTGRGTLKFGPPLNISKNALEEALKTIVYVVQKNLS